MTNAPNTKFPKPGLILLNCSMMEDELKWLAFRQVVELTLLQYVKALHEYIRM